MKNVTSAGPLDVFILTYCRKMDLFYGTGLIFKTLRRGFPNARVAVIDNCSIPEARHEVEQLARDNDCSFRSITAPEIEHHEFLEDTLARAAGTQTRRPIVFLDPDICLWENCENFEFDGLMAGRLILGYNDDFLESLLMPRLHTSFLWIPDALRLAAEIERIKRPHLDFRPFLCFSAKIGDVWVRYDTGASLYAAMPGQLSHFGPEHMDCYDHIFCGSHLDLTRKTYSGKTLAMMERIHADARAGNLDALRGIYREQSEIWREAYAVIE